MSTWFVGAVPFRATVKSIVCPPFSETEGGDGVVEIGWICQLPSMIVPVAVAVPSAAVLGSELASSGIASIEVRVTVKVRSSVGVPSSCVGTETLNGLGSPACTSKEPVSPSLVEYETRKSEVAAGSTVTGKLAGCPSATATVASPIETVDTSATRAPPRVANPSTSATAIAAATATRRPRRTLTRIELSPPTVGSTRKQPREGLATPP